jgi:hypothetical protein
MDLKTTAEKLPLEEDPDEISTKSLYKIVFKNNKHTILSYFILNRLIPEKDDYRLYKLDYKDDEYPIVNLPNIDIVYFMGMLTKMLYYSNTNVLLTFLNNNERTVYDYLFIDK